MLSLNNIIRKEYILYCSFLIPLVLLPDSFWRLCYLHGVSMLLIFFTDYKLRFFTLVAMIHSIIHHVWPFLDNTGYKLGYTPFYDVLCHILMMYFAYEVINSHIKKKDLQWKSKFKYLTYFFIIGAIINCLTAICSYQSFDSQCHQYFAWTSIFQAVSTGFWIATMLWYEKWNDHKFFTHWLVIIVIICANWGLYKYSHDILALAMDYRYIEAIFMVSTWTPFFAKL